MRRALRVVVYAMAAVIVGGTVASAVPGVRSSPSEHPSPSFAPSATPSPTVVPTPQPSEVPATTPEPTAAESPEPLEEKDPAPTGSDNDSGTEASHGSSGAPDFSACVGLTGLENAVCRHEVLVQLHPGNAGLANSLAHLRENLDKHASSGSGSSHARGDPHGGGTD
ncbi:MAG: hypothetical protein ACJ758_03675 [Actinomycetota bacterium]